MNRRTAAFRVAPVSALLVLAGWAAAGDKAAGDPLRPRDLAPVSFLEAPKHAPVEIVRDGNATALICLADPRFIENPDPKKRGKRPEVLKQLADQLRGSVKAVTGAELPFVTNAPPADRNAIVIGDCEESRSAGIEAGKIPPEGFVVKTAPNRVYLVGSTAGWGRNGAAWAIADFLERFVGVRWYWPGEYGGFSMPRARSLAVPPVHYTDHPVFARREMYQDWYWTQARSFDENLIPLNPEIFGPNKTTLWMGDHFRLMRQGSSWPHEAVQQGARIYEYMRNVPKTNSAWFAVNEDGSRNFGVFCYSAPETLDCYLANLESAWDGDRKGVFIGGITRSSITMWPSLDLGNESQVSACRCRACRETLARGGDELLMGLFVKRLCEEVGRRWPDKVVVYVPWSIVRCPAGLEFPGNLVVNSLEMGAMGLMQQPGVRGWREANLRQWSEKSGRPVNMWIDFASPSDWTYGPVQFPHLVKDFYLKNRDCLSGGNILSYGGSCFITAAPTCYVWNRVLWNPEVDVDAVLDGMCSRLFGAGSESARELLRMQCDRWENTALSRPLLPGDHRIPVGLFREIWPPDVVARMKMLRDKALDAIEAAGDAGALKSFLYWTWEFDAFADYSAAVDRVLTLSSAGQAAEPPAAGAAAAGDDAMARFRGGAESVNIARVANVRVAGAADRAVAPSGGGAAPEAGDILFDLSCGSSWRAKWIEPGARNVTGSDLPVESWSAAWVFAKYRLPGGDKQGWSHATLSARAADHSVPAGAKLDVGLSGDGAAGVGAFIYRDATGYGPLELKDVRLRWLHGADGVTNPAAAELKVFALDMVYVPAGAFLAGSGGTEEGSFTDGSWNGGAAIPFLVDAKWSGPLAEGSAARRIGNKAGRLWGTSIEGRAGIGPEGEICDAFPTGSEPFYCMRYEVTRGLFTEFLNALPRDVFDATSAGDSSHAGGHFTAAGRYGLSGFWPKLEAAEPYQACNLLSWWDCARLAAWTGLRPMTELEYEKACRGPLNPAPEEYAWGTERISTAEYTVADAGKAAERIVGNYATAAGNANYDFTMPASFGKTSGGVSVVPGSPMRAGIFATPDSGRAAAGASYWGIMEMSGNVREQLIAVSDPKGRAFRGSHGTGSLEVPDDWPAADFSAGKDFAVGSGFRGGFFGDMPSGLRVSDRSHGAYRPRPGSFSALESRQDQNGFRAARTAPEAARSRNRENQAL